MEIYITTDGQTALYVAHDEHGNAMGCARDLRDLIALLLASQPCKAGLNELPRNARGRCEDAPCCGCCTI